MVASCVGNDSLGDFCVNQLQSRGIDSNLIQRASEPTSMVLVNKSNGTPTPIFYRGADKKLEYNTALEQTLSRFKVLHFSCWPISQPISRKTVEKAVGVAKEKGILIGFDPNYHPHIWESGHDGIGYIKSLIPKVDVIKPSEDDATRLFGQATPKEHIERFLELGAKLVIMTLGEKGAMVGNGTAIKEFETKATQVEDTTGAGDAFWSGFYMAIIKGETIDAAINYGSAVSAYKLKFVGAVVELPPFGYFLERV